MQRPKSFDLKMQRPTLPLAHAGGKPKPEKEKGINGRRDTIKSSRTQSLEKKKVNAIIGGKDNVQQFGNSKAWLRRSTTSITAKAADADDAAAMVGWLLLKGRRGEVAEEEGGGFGVVCSKNWGSLLLWGGGGGGFKV
ncbi:hypothetical protein Droror1_Dr00006436 [Drosera rotundifolia]